MKCSGFLLLPRKSSLKRIFYRFLVQSREGLLCYDNLLTWKGVVPKLRAEMEDRSPRETSCVTAQSEGLNPTTTLYFCGQWRELGGAPSLQFKSLPNPQERELVLKEKTSNFLAGRGMDGRLRAGSQGEKPAPLCREPGSWSSGVIVISGKPRS